MARVGVWTCMGLAWALSIAAGVGTLGAELHLPSGALAPGVELAGAAVEGVPGLSPVGSPGGGEESGPSGQHLSEVQAPRDARAAIEALARRLESVPIEFRMPAADVPGVASTLGEVGLRVDVDASVRRALAVGRRGSPLTRLRELRRAAREGVRVPLALELDRARLLERLLPLKERWDRPAIGARRPADGRVVADVPGRHLDLARAADEVWAVGAERAARLAETGVDSGAVVALGSRTVPARVDARALGSFRPRQVLAEYTTRFRSRGDQASRAENIAVAAARLDGIVLMPGDRFSFNDAVGERSLANGFLDSWELLDGKFVRGVGGGTCQVSSTLNAAALRAGLELVESQTHSRPLAYIEKGLDATVSWPFVDLKLKNPWPVPVVIQATVRGGSLDVRVVAESSPGRVAVHSEIKETYPFPRVVEVGRVASGAFKRDQEGIPGYRIQRTRFIWSAAGEPRKEVVFKRYRPTPEVFSVAPGFDVEQLPPLPEGAEGYDPALVSGAPSPGDPSIAVRAPIGWQR